MKDLHLHLSGATDPRLLYEMINETGLKIKTKDFWDFKKAVSMSKDIKNLEDYLKVLHIIDEAQSSPRAIKMSVYNSFVNAYMNGCEYLEIRWNPYKRSKGFKIDLDKLIISARAGYEKAKSIFGIRGGLILCLGRDIPNEANEAIFKKAIQYNGKGVIGIDIAGSEAGSKLNPEFEHYYRTANALGLITTIHLGEVNYPSLEEKFHIVLDKYKPKRIGHGVQIHRFPQLMKKASKRGVLLETCITSNLTTKNVESEEKFAEIFKIFEDNKINYHICTDATFPMDTNIRKENEKYERIREMARKR